MFTPTPASALPPPPSQTNSHLLCSVPTPPNFKRTRSLRRSKGASIGHLQRHGATLERTYGLLSPLREAAGVQGRGQWHPPSTGLPAGAEVGRRCWQGSAPHHAQTACLLKSSNGNTHFSRDCAGDRQLPPKKGGKRDCCAGHLLSKTHLLSELLSSLELFPYFVRLK